MSNVKQPVHRNKDATVPKGIRLRRSQWAELEAIRLRRGQQSVQEAVRDAVEQFIAQQRAA
ncbi:MAG TPA: hypothetical protein VF167_15380 [Longimicrobiaceae bacterium]